VGSVDGALTQQLHGELRLLFAREDAVLPPPETATSLQFGQRRLISLASSSPSMRGIARSVITRSQSRSSNFSTASSPSAAVATS